MNERFKELWYPSDIYTDKPKYSYAESLFVKALQNIYCRWVLGAQLNLDGIIGFFKNKQ